MTNLVLICLGCFFNILGFFFLTMADIQNIQNNLRLKGVFQILAALCFMLCGKYIYQV